MLADDHDSISYDWVSITKISPYLKQAVVLTEDDTFFEHNGFDVEAIKKAYKVNVRRHKFAKGGSTITMQLARNLFLSSDKSILRKLRELAIAVKLESELPKERILELYLNVAQWGDGIYGAQAAARHYFGKDAINLSKHEAAFLAAILPRPKFYDKHRSGAFISRRIATIESRL